MRGYSAVLAVSAVIGLCQEPLSAQAPARQSSGTDLVNSVAACRGITDPARRLACYDEAATQLTSGGWPQRGRRPQPRGYPPDPPLPVRLPPSPARHIRRRRARGRGVPGRDYRDRLGCKQYRLRQMADPARGRRGLADHGIQLSYPSAACGQQRGHQAGCDGRLLHSHRRATKPAGDAYRLTIPRRVYGRFGAATPAGSSRAPFQTRLQ